MILRHARTALAVLVLAALLVPCLAAAQNPAPTGSWQSRNQGFAVAGVANFPNKDFGKRSETGYGLAGFWVKPVIPLVTVTASAGWNHFPGEGDLPSADVWSFTGGFRFEFGAFYMGGEGGYYTEIDEGGFIPSIGLHIKKFEVAGRWKSSGTSTWTTLRVGYYF